MPGSLVILRTPGGEALGVATFNPHSLIAARLLTSNPEAIIDALFFGRRLANAMALRDRLVGVPYYRLIHAEADGLPGVIIDRFGDALHVDVDSPGSRSGGLSTNVYNIRTLFEQTQRVGDGVSRLQK